MPPREVLTALAAAMLIPALADVGPPANAAEGPKSKAPRKSGSLVMYNYVQKKPGVRKAKPSAQRKGGEVGKYNYQMGWPSK